MNTLLLIAVVGQSWSYDNFAADPPKAKPPVVKPALAPAPAKNNLLRSPDCNCPPYACMCEIPCRCAKPAEPAKEAPKTWVPIYRRDSQGNQCTGYAGYERELDAFILGRNSALAAQQAQAPVQTYTPIPQAPGTMVCDQNGCRVMPY